VIHDTKNVGKPTVLTCRFPTFYGCLLHLYSQELEKEKSDSESHETGAYVSSIEQLFDDVLNDEEEMKKLYRVFVQASKISYPQK
jgi:hypothetical protein